ISEDGVLVEGSAQLPVGLELTDGLRPLPGAIQHQAIQFAHRSRPGDLVGERTEDAPSVLVALPLIGVAGIGDTGSQLGAPARSSRGGQLIDYRAGHVMAPTARGGDPLLAGGDIARLGRPGSGPPVETRLGRLRV